MTYKYYYGSMFPQDVKHGLSQFYDSEIRNLDGTPVSPVNTKLPLNLTMSESESLAHRFTHESALPCHGKTSV